MSDKNNALKIYFAHIKVLLKCGISEVFLQNLQEFSYNKILFFINDGESYTSLFILGYIGIFCKYSMFILF